MFDKLRAMILGMTIQGGKGEQDKEVRRLGLSIAKIARKPGQFIAAVKGIGETEAFHHAETSTWLSPEAIAAGNPGPFEACNLLAWLEIARKARVVAVPAKVILHLSDRETELAGSQFEMPRGPIPDRIRNRVKDAIQRDAESFRALADQESDIEKPVDCEALLDKLFDCMDDVPENWMVRTTQCGPASLKSLAGCGIAGETAPEVRFGADLEIGPGWVRIGNRRRVDTQDMRLVKSYVAGPHTGMIFIARPWIEAARYIEADDPHRHGSPFQGPGRWPMEWRAFVKGGKVTGVSVYYPWASEGATPQNARIALEVRDAAQRMVDAAIAQGLEPRLMDVEHARRNPELAAMLENQGFGHGSFACTLDFIETQQGLMLLEGGPGHTPMGGGHPCGFAGTTGRPTFGNPMDTAGVAFRHMAHVLIGEPESWSDGDREGCILGWDAVAELAASNVA